MTRTQQYGALLIGVGAIAIIALYRNVRRATTNEQNTSKDMNNNTTNSNLPRGYRNNNPLNIRISRSNWQGKVSPNTDGVFEQFTTMAYGYRAAMKLINTYITKYGCNTLAKIISRWAPENENNTSGYIQRVCNTTGYTADTYISPTDEQQMCSLMYAMSLVENGTKILPDKEAITAGWKLYIA